jgi:hypothetical protein
MPVISAGGAADHPSGAEVAWQRSSLARSFASAERLVRASDAGATLAVDCGEITAFIASVNDLHALRTVAADALRPELLMDESGRDVYARISGVLTVIDRVIALFGEESVVRLALRPGSFDTRLVREAVRDLAVLGLVTDGVVIAPMAKKRGREEVSSLRQSLQTDGLDVRVWRARTMRVAPKGAAAFDRLGRVLPVTSVGEARGAGAGEYIGTCAATGLDSADLRVGTHGEFLVLSTPSVQRLLPLPSTLVRCRPVDAGVDAQGVHVHFVADPALWPESISPGTTASGGAGA